MAYIKNNWVDREGTTRYFEAVDTDGAKIFTPDYTQVTEMGTPVNADNMNHIEEGIAAGSFTKYDSMATYAKNDLVTTIVDNELKVYKSLQDNNTNALDNPSLWEEVEFSGGGTGLQMFDTVLKDHILTYEESKGLALQGTYVYKEAIAGSRYGYPDFYNKVVEEYNESEVYYLPWVQPIATGETTAIEGGDMVITASSAYSNYNAYKAMDGIDTSTTATTGWGTNNTSAVQWWQVKFPYKIRITGLTGYQRYDSTPANANTIGQFYTSSEKTTPIGDEYSNAVGVNWNAVSVTGIPAEGIVTDTIYFEKTGGGNHGGFGELKIEATYPTPFYKNANGHIFYNIADKTAIDEIIDKNSTAWLYGVDTENKRVFLPYNNGFRQLIEKKEPTADDQTWFNLYSDGYCEQGGIITIGGNANSTVTFLKPFINTDYYASAGVRDNTQGAAEYSGLGTNYTTNTMLIVNGVARTCAFVWQAKGYVEKPQTQDKLLYICVGNTETVSSITDVVDVTTTENDTVPLFTGQYFDFKPNNVSWLKGGEQANNAGIYATCYNELVNVLNGETKYGDLKVVDTTDMIAGVDYSEYWKVNQDEMTFTTPTAISNKALSGAVVGNGLALGLTNGTINAGLGATSSTYDRLYAREDNFGANVSTSISSSSTVLTGTIGITTDPTKSGIIAEQSTAQLYFKVANAVQNLELLDAGKVMEAVANKADIDLNNTIASQNFINQSISWGMPDYSAGLQITLSATDFVAPCDGIVAGDGNRAGTDNETNIYVNGAFVGKTTNSSQAISINLSKGDALTVSAGTVTTYFYPLKGVN